MNFETEPLPDAYDEPTASAASALFSSSTSSTARTQSPVLDAHDDINDDNNSSIQQRRTSLPALEHSHRRASIQRIMRDADLSPLEKQRSIQFLMDGRKLLQRRVTVECGSSSGSRNMFGIGNTSSVMNGTSRRSSINAHNSIGGAAVAATCARRNAMVGEESDEDGDDDDDQEEETVEEISSDIVKLRRRRSSSSLENVKCDVPDYDAITAAAIAHAKSQTASDFFASQHPYKATTTMVPAIAAEASASALLASRRQKQQQQQQNHQQYGSNSIDHAKSAIEMAPKCTHYQRNCHIVSPCCGATFACRICHDDFPVLPPPLLVSAYGSNSTNNPHQRALRTLSMPLSFANSAGEHHTLPRHAIKEIICRVCYTKQSSKT